MAVEKREAINCRRHVHLDLLEAFYEHDILQNAGRGERQATAWNLEPSDVPYAEWISGVRWLG